MMSRKFVEDFIARVEKHRAEEEALWAALRKEPGYEDNQDKDIAFILQTRAQVRTLREDADGVLGGFDLVDDGTGNFVPREAA